MKRMSEVFQLPLIYGENNLYHACNNHDWYMWATFYDPKEAMYTAHAINHVDALADALESVVEMAWLISDDLGDEFSARPEIIVAQKALAAYRGEK